MNSVSVIIPVFNEVKSIQTLLKRVAAQKLIGLGVNKLQVIIVDDGSTDGTRKMLRRYKQYQIIFHQKNRGLMAAMMTGIKAARGEVIVIQHSDLEYHPKDWPKLLRPILNGKADMVMGSRYLKQKRIHFNQGYEFGGQTLTRLFNWLYSTNFTDIFTAHRAFKQQVGQVFRPLGNGFTFETEITAQAVKRNFRIGEVAISYKSRNFDEGKKLRWHDGLAIVVAMVKNRFTMI